VAPAQALLAGRQHTYDPSIGTASWSSSSTAASPEHAVECFEVTAAEASALYQILDANGQIIHDGGSLYEQFFNEARRPTARGWWAGANRIVDLPDALRANEENLNVLIASPVFPHGQYIIF
jgi:hypothetical protein